jgi:asparagine synthase (glutamine-hydrolysing)
VAFSTELLNGGRMNSFSTVYPVKGMDESRYVDLVSQRYNTIAHRITPEPSDFLSRVEKITWHQDIPLSTPTVYSQHFVMKLAHGNVTVLLDGQGADELFAGYLSYAVIYLSDLHRRDPVRWAGEMMQFVAGVYPRFFASQSLREFGARALHYLVRGRKPVPLLTSEMTAIAERRQSCLPPRELDSDDAVNNHLYRTLVRDSIPSLLHFEDRNSMAYSIEARVPFLDHRLAEFVMGVPANQKIRGAETKVFMRRALRGILPDEVVNRKDKLGYPTPFSQWLRGPLRKEVDTYLHDTVFKRDWYHKDAVRKLWHDHLSGARNNDAAIFRLITAEQWYRMYGAAV